MPFVEVPLARSPLPLAMNRNKVESMPKGDLENTFEMSGFLDKMQN
jgi:hypothetical protein